jgi:hydrogenase expression/formation protein HypD
MLERGKPALENEYTRAVSKEGNRLAVHAIDSVFERRGDIWRGLGIIEASGLGIRPKYAGFDAEKKFSLKISDAPVQTACRCGEVIKGRLHPEKCPLFGTVCVPENPVGPCMVSSEGACAAAYKYQGI